MTVCKAIPGPRGLPCRTTAGCSWAASTASTISIRPISGPIPYPGEPMFTGLKVFGQRVVPGGEYDGRVLLREPLNRTRRLELGYRQSNFTLEFTSDQYVNPAKNLFRYRLEGYDPDWTVVGAGSVSLPTHGFRRDITASGSPRRTATRFGATGSVRWRSSCIRRPGRPGGPICSMSLLRLRWFLPGYFIWCRVSAGAANSSCSRSSRRRPVNFPK